MADVGWPFYGLDFAVQPDISAAGYFDQLSAMVGIDLMEMYAALQTAGLSAGAGSDAAVSSVSDRISDDSLSDSVPRSGFEPDGAAASRYPVSGSSNDDGAAFGRGSVGGLGLWMDMLGMAENAGFDGYSWDFAGMGVPGSSGRESAGQTARQFALYNGTDDWLQQSMSVFVGLSGLDAVAGGNGVSLGEALDAAAAGALWQKAASADSFAAFSGTAPLSPAAAQMSALRADGVASASLPDARIPPEMLWSDEEDRLLDKLERRLGIEIANSTEGAFG